MMYNIEILKYPILTYKLYVAICEIYKKDVAIDSFGIVSPAKVLQFWLYEFDTIFIKYSYEEVIAACIKFKTIYEENIGYSDLIATLEGKYDNYTKDEYAQETKTFTENYKKEHKAYLIAKSTKQNIFNIQ